MLASLALLFGGDVFRIKGDAIELLILECLGHAIIIKVFVAAM